MAGLADSTILWGFCVALGMAYMLNRDILRPAAVDRAVTRAA